MTEQAWLDHEFQGQNGGGEIVIKRLSIGSVVRSAVTSRANACDVPRIVGPSVAQAADMMCFQVGAAGSGDKGRRKVARLADPICASEHIVANIPRSLVGGSWCRQCSRGCICRSLVSARPKGLEARYRCRIGDNLRGLPIDLQKRIERKHYSLSRQPVTALLSLKMPSSRDELPFEGDWSAVHGLRKDKEIFSVHHVISDRAVSALKGHVTRLALTGVEQRAIGLKSVVISSDVSTHLCDGEDYRISSRRAYAPLFLTPERPVQVVPAGVRAIRDEWPMHNRMVRALVSRNKEACA